MLLRIEEVPSYLQGNPYIHTGYRAFLSKSQCLSSVFSWTNETVNIWTHLLGFFLFFGFLILDAIFLTPNLNLTFGDVFCMVFFDVAFMYAMASSTVYHIFSCHNEDAYRRYLKWDIGGVSIGGMGGFVFGQHTIFHCFQTYRTVLQIANAVVAILVLGFHYKAQHNNAKDHKYMTWILAGWVMLGIPVLFLYVYLVGGFRVPEAQSVLLQTFVYYLLMGAGFLFYVSFYPERCCPGRVDYLGSSHQLWHVFVLSGFTWWHQCCVSMLQNRVLYSCNYGT